MGIQHAVLTVDSGTTTPAIDAIPQPAFAGAAMTGAQSSSAGDDGLQLPRMHVASMLRILGSANAVYDFVLSGSSIPCGLPQVDFDPCQDDCIHWQFLRVN